MTKIQVQKTSVKRSKAVEARRQWAKFGDCKGLPHGVFGDNVTTPTIEDVYVDLKQSLKTDEEGDKPKAATAWNLGIGNILFYFFVLSF